MANPEIEIQIRNERTIVIFFIFGLFIAPLIAALNSETHYDILRAFVLTETAGVFLLYGLSLAEGIVKLWRGAYGGAPVVRRLLKARMARIAACMIFMVDESVTTIDRLGNPVMNWRTPTLQIVLIMLLYAWSYIDRSKFEDADALTEVHGILDETIMDEIKRRG